MGPRELHFAMRASVAGMIHEAWGITRDPDPEDVALAEVLMARERELLRRALDFVGRPGEVMLEAAIQHAYESMLSDDDKPEDDDEHERDRCQCDRCVSKAVDAALSHMDRDL